MLGLCFAAAAPGGALLPAGGVLVLEVDVLDDPLVPNCFVGDFTGDRRPVPNLAPGVGLPAMMLALLPAPFTLLSLLNPFTAVCTLFGLPLPATPLLVMPGLTFGFTSSTTCRTPAGLRNMPYPSSHSKYLSPLTEPSFLPVGSSSSTPIQSPVWKDVEPTKRTVATRPSFNSIFWPMDTDVVFIFDFVANSAYHHEPASFDLSYVEVRP